MSKSKTKGSALVSLKVWLSCTILDSTKIETSFLKLCYKKLDIVAVSKQAMFEMELVLVKLYNADVTNLCLLVASSLVSW